MKQNTLLNNQEVAFRLKHLQGCIESLRVALVKFTDGTLTSSYELTDEQFELQRQLDDIESKSQCLASDLKAKTANREALKTVLSEKTKYKTELSDESTFKNLER